MNRQLRFLFGSLLLFAGYTLYKSINNPSQQMLKTSPIAPSVTIVIIVDQCAYFALKKAAPYMHGGIHELLTTGVVYENAHFPYSRTSTGPGHATMSTGTLPKDHGIIGDKWYTNKGEKILCDFDTEDNAVIAPNDMFYTYGKSAHNLGVDSISDQLALESPQNSVWALSLKSRAAIFSAARKGKAVWFDNQAAQFTSSKAYCTTLPSWIKDFNSEKDFASNETIIWQSYYPLTDAGYSMVKNDYTFARLPSLINEKTDKQFFEQDSYKQHEDFEFLTHYPQSNQWLLDLATQCLKESLKNNAPKILLWVSLSSLDKIGHIYGPDSFEFYDTLYHIDNYLKDFMQSIRTILPTENVTYVLTADHGSTPIVELMQKDGFSLAQRFLINQLAQEINEFLEKKYSMSNCVNKIDVPSIHLDHTALDLLPSHTKKEIIRDIKKIVKQQPGIQAVWTTKQLEKMPVQSNDIISYYKNQLFKDRLGYLLYHVSPYTYPAKHPKGTCHTSPYDYTTHVPLIIKDVTTSAKSITQRVSMTQLAPTLAKILSIATPSACLDNALPN